MLRWILLVIFIFCHKDSFSQSWEVISDRLLESISDTTYQDDVLNRSVGAIAVLPKSGYLLLVLNGRHSVYKSKDLGESWQALDKVVKMDFILVIPKEWTGKR
jgi:hypothetical protein